MKTNISWWRRYRKQKYKKRYQLTTEIILRKSFIDTLKEYLDNTSLGGIKQIRDQNNSKIERLFWLVVYCFAFFSVCLFLHRTWMKTFANPLIVTSESSTYPIKDIDFPAVALCNFNRISRKALSALVADTSRRYNEQTHTTNFSKSKLKKMYRHMGNLIDYRYEESIHNLVDELPWEYFNNITYIMKKLAPICEEMLIKCQWAGEEVNCAQIFHTRSTAMGHCCAFNYVLERNPNGRFLTHVKRQQVSGSNNGLRIVADPMFDDYAYRLDNRVGFQVLLYDPRQFPDLSAGRVLYHIAQPNQQKFLQINSIKQYATSEVRKYPLTTRKCLFRYELKSKYSGMYSYNACLVRCRVTAIHSLCKCIPYFYASELKDYMKICTLRHLRCLNKYKEKFLHLYPMDVKNKSGLESELVNSLYCPDCLPDCELTQHFARNYKVSLPQISRNRFESNFLVGLNLTDRCIVTIHHQTSVGILYRLDIVVYWFEILSNIGGYAGMVMGIGCYTFIEILYYVIIRFTQILHKNYTASR